MTLILAKYSEMWLKSESVRKKFTLRLKKNILDLFDNENIVADVLMNRDYILIKSSDIFKEKLKKCLACVCGIEYFCFADYCELEKEPKQDIKKNLNKKNKFGKEKEKKENLNIEQKTNTKKINFKLDDSSKKIITCFYCRNILEQIKITAKKELGKKQTFAVRVKRHGEHPFKSNDVEICLGDFICRTFGNKVDLTKPDKTFFVEIRNENVWTYTERTGSQGGLPFGVEGNIICLIRNKGKYMQEDIKAGRAMLKRGGELYPILIGQNITEQEILFAANKLKKYDAKIQNKISKINCSNLHINEFKEELNKKINSTKSKAICIGLKLDGLEEFYTSAKLFSSRNIVIDRIPIFMPNLCCECKETGAVF